MLKKRIVAVVVVRDGIVVQSIGFKTYRPVGKPEITVEFLCQWGADEIILLDISATRADRGPDIEMVKRVAKKCLLPLTVGGGITKLEHVNCLIHGGADKVSLNYVLFENLGFLSEIAKTYGNQSVVVSIDALKTDNGYRVYDYVGAFTTNHSVKTLAPLVTEYGAGEILINSVNRDGLGTGFDINLVDEVCGSVSVPVVCVGGAGSPQHFVEVFKTTQVHGAAAANYFHFSEHSVMVTKSKLISEGIAVRIDTQSDYASAVLDPRGRLLKKPDFVLEELLFEPIEKEVL